MKYMRMKQIAALLLAVVLLICLLPEMTPSVAAEGSDGGFEFSLHWYRNEEHGGENTCLYDSDSRESRMIRLKISYKNNNVTGGYAPGELIVTVPGLKDAVRSGRSYVPAAVAADRASDAEKKYDWSYTYSSISDTFTFTNNTAVSEKATFEGSFEIVWELPSEVTVTEFSKSLQAQLVTAKGEAAESNPVTYIQRRMRDEYQLTETVTPIESPEGICIPHGTLAEQYIWSAVTVDPALTERARAIDETKERRYELWFPEGTLVYGGGTVRQRGTTRLGADGRTYELWTADGSEGGLTGIIAAYPRALYEGATIKNYAEYYGTYLDEDEECLLAQSEQDIRLADYEFINPPGDIYDISKQSYGIQTNRFLSQHCAYCEKYGAVNGATLADGKTEYSSNLGIRFFFRDETADSYDFEMVDDIMDVLLKDGTLRRLRDGEYHFTKVVIPSSFDILNSNGLPLAGDAEYCLCENKGECADDSGTTPCAVCAGKAEGGSGEALSYQYALFVRKAGAATDDWTLVTDDTARISTLAQEIDISSYNACAFKLVIYGVTQGFQTEKIKCSYVFHTDDDDIRTDGGRVDNNVYFKLYRTEGGVTEWFNDDFGRETYSSDREFERDRELYGSWLKDGMGLDREVSALHILEIPNQFSVSNNLEIEEQTKYKLNLTGTITANVTLGEGNELGCFSLYTIVPEGLRLSELADTPEELLRRLTFTTSDGIPSAYIEEHVTLEIIEDYNGSGRQYIAFHFDFSDRPITPESLTISGLPMSAYIEDIDDGSVNVSFTMRAEMMIDDNGKWSSDSYDGNRTEEGIWVDMDGDGDTTETASFSYSKATVRLPEETKLELTKFIRTSETDGFVNPTDITPLTHVDEEYSYRLRIAVGETGVKNVVFFDALENADGTQWKGEFLRVDCTAAEKIFGREPVIYYSEQVENFSAGVDLSGGSWTTVRPATVRSIAISFGDAEAPAKSVVSVDVYMKAPSEEDYFNTPTINECATSYTFVNGVDGWLNSVAVSAQFMEKTGELTLVKRDQTDGSVLTGAVFRLYRQLGGAPNPETDEAVLNAEGNNEYVIGSTGKITVSGLAFGTYYFKEVRAPRGYHLSSELAVAELTEASPVAKIDFENERKQGQFTFRKVSDRQPELGLAGAEFALYAADGTELRTGLTTDADGSCTVTGLAWGEYYLKETKAPAGYALSDETIPFSVNAGNDAGRLEGKDGVTTVVNEQLPASASLTKYEVLENGQQSSTKLSGAVFELYSVTDAGDKKLGAYITDENGVLYAEDLTFGTYYFVETVAPKGYVRSSEKHMFTVSEEHTEASCPVLVYNPRKTGSVNLRKLDDKGANVSGAVYGLFDAVTGTRIDETRAASEKRFVTNEEGVVDITGLYWGNYYLQEVEAPKGYEKNEAKYEFTVSSDTVDATIAVLAHDDRLLGTVELTKCAEQDETILLENAVFTLYRNDGTVYRDNLTTDANGKLTVTGIEWGSYYFLEKTAPTGYGLNPQKIRFSVNYLTASKTQYFTVTDPIVKSKLTVAKRIKISDIVFEHGNPTFTFHVEGRDVSGGAHSYFKTIAFNQEYVERYLADHPGADYVEASVSFVDIPAGEYTVSEVETNRYETETVTVTNGTVEGTGAKFVFSDTNPDGEAVFTNRKNYQGATSHAAAAANIVNRARRLTAIIADYKGPETVRSKLTLDESVLTVYAVYDDGTQRVLEKAADGYVVNPETISDEISGTFTVTVTYTEDGITRTDSFELEVAISDVFTWDEPVNEPIYDASGNKLYDGTVEITGYTGNSSIVRIPETVTGWISMYDNGTTHMPMTHVGPDWDGKVYKVVAVKGHGWKAMYGVQDKTGIVLPDTLERIGWQAFRDCSGLTGNLVIPDGVQEIEEGAFMNCSKLTGNLVIPDNVKVLGKEAFRNCEGFDGELTLSGNLTSIGESAFFGCKKLTGDLYLPDTCTTIGARAFEYCEGFNGSLHLPEKLEKIDIYTFYECKNLTGELQLPTTLKTIGHGAFTRCTGLSGTLTVPASVTVIGDGLYERNGAFDGCTGLTGLVMQEGVQTIGERAFYGCTGLTEGLQIPATVKTIGANAFRNCTGLPGLDMREGVQTIGENAFRDCTGLTGELQIPATVRNIGHGAFYGCNKLTGQLVIPASVETIGSGSFDWNGAFQNCTGFTGLTISDGVQNIGAEAFFGCTGMKGALTIPDSVKTIGHRAFANCSGFDGALSLPKDLTSIEMNTFYGCSGLTGELHIPDGVTAIKYGAFYNCSKLTGTLVIPDSVTAIGVDSYENCGAFQGCKGLTGLRLGSGVKTVGKRAFYGCTGMSGDLTIPDSVTAIESEAFRGSLFDGQLNLGSGLTTLADHAFWSCYKLQGDVTIPSGVKTIGSEAFFNCRSMTRITVPATVTGIETSAFGNFWQDIPSPYDNMYLEELVLPTGFSGETFGADTTKTTIIYRD